MFPMNPIRGFLRFAGFLLIVVFYASKAFFLRWRHPDNPQVIYRTFREFARTTTRALQAEVEVAGPLPQRGVLLMPNHRSYIDIALLPLFTDCSHVAKAEVRKWPVIGPAAEVAQTLFVDRSSKESRRQAREALKEKLTRGHSVVVFPEGTTTKAPHLSELHPGMFYTAAEAEVPIVPVAIEYEDPEAAWVDDDTFFPHFVRCFGKKTTRAKLVFGEELRGTDGAELKQQVAQWLRTELADLQRYWKHDTSLPA